MNAKQERYEVRTTIACQKIMPYYEFFGRESYFKTPTGGLILHWIATTIFIIATPTEKGIIDDAAYTFIISIYIYGHGIISGNISSRVLSIHCGTFFA